jgi:aerobic carbon-monoxide dehydrogenase large subunit
MGFEQSKFANAGKLAKFGVGQPVRRVEDQRFVTGHGQYTSDIMPAGTLHAVLVRSPHAHATFRITDVEAARKIKGVKLVLTAADVAHLGKIACGGQVANADKSPTPYPDYRLLAVDTVKHVGDAVAFVVADTAERARDAAEAIAIKWTALPAVSDTRAAMAKGASLVWPDAPGNIVYDTSMGDKAKADAAFAKAHRTVKLEIENNRLVTNYMETRACLAEYDPKAKSWSVTLGSQGVHGLQKSLASIMNVKPDKVRVITPDVGGGFGTKTFMYREYPLCAEAARLLKRPVRWTAERTEHFLADAHGRDNITIAEVALDKAGRFLAMRFDLMGNLGSYLSQYGPYIHYLGATMLTGVYATPVIYARVRGVFSNTVPVDAYRGAGRPEAAYVLERLVETAAHDIGMAPDKLRLLNFVTPSQMPYSTPIGGRKYDTGDFAGHLGKSKELADWAGFKAREKTSRKAGKLRGIGLGTYIECTAWGSGEDVNIQLETDGTVTVLSGTQSNGQGHATAYAQFVSQHLDIPLSQIRVVQGDTARVATGNGTGGSRSVPVGGVATFLAAQALAENLKIAAADILEAGSGDLEISEGAVRIKGTDRKVTFANLAASPKVDPSLLKAKGDFTPPDATYPNGTHIAEVEIDPDTGVVSLQRYTICDDFGMTVNPLLLGGQVHGGIAQGVGQALMERTVYDKGGQLLSASMMDYCMPRADDVPYFHFETRNVPSTTNPLGMKGAGEAGSIGSCPAVMNAIVDTLYRTYGIRHIDMPATPQHVFAAIRGARLKAAE